MRFLKPGDVRRIFRGVLKREPTLREISGFALSFGRDPDFEKQLKAMIYSKEFLIMIMPDLVRAATESYTGKKIFFIHIPKTAGTSVRLALVDALGVPSLNLYPASTQLLPEKLSSMEFWPYWAGHANISTFPETHVGFTTFRESRSRILSQFRQNQRNATPGSNPHLISKAAIESNRKNFNELRVRDFNYWIERSGQTILPWYIPNPYIKQDMKADGTRENYRMKVGTDVKWTKHVLNMSELEVSRELEKSIPRIGAAAWLHQPKGIIAAIAKVTGNPNATLPNENEFKKTELYKEETISLETLRALEEVRKRDRMVFKLAADLGILTDELKIDEDEIFHKSIEKLGFKLP